MRQNGRVICLQIVLYLKCGILKKLSFRETSITGTAMFVSRNTICRVSLFNSLYRKRHKKNCNRVVKCCFASQRRERRSCIEWSIADRAPPYHCKSKRCNLCLAEKLTILRADQTLTLNSRLELVSKCRHRYKFKLKNFK